MNEFQHQIMEHCAEQLLNPELEPESRARYNEIMAFTCPDQMFWNWVFDDAPRESDNVLADLMEAMYNLEETITNRALSAPQK